MTGNDVIAAAPWIYFGTTVAAVCGCWACAEFPAPGRTGPRRPWPATTAAGAAGPGG
jgi:hypothetical protein